MRNTCDRRGSEGVGLVIAAVVVGAAILAAMIWFGWLLGEVSSAGTDPQTVLRAQGFFAVCNLGWLLGFILIIVEAVGNGGYVGDPASRFALVGSIGRGVVTSVVLVQFIGSCILAPSLVRAHRLAKGQAAVAD